MQPVTGAPEGLLARRAGLQPLEVRVSDILLVAGAGLLVAAAYFAAGLAGGLATGGVMLVMVAFAIERA